MASFMANQSSARGDEGAAPTTEFDRTPAVTRPRLWFVCPILGRNSEPWLLRQATRVKRFDVRMVSWGVDRGAIDSPTEWPARVLPFDRTPYEGRGRWLFRLRNLRSRNFYGTVAAERRLLQDWVRSDRPDVILCHFGHVALRILPVAVRAGTPIVAHFHGLDVSSSLRNRWYRSSLLRALPRFAATIVVGAHQHRWMVAQGVPPERVHLIPCGVPVAEFAPPDREQRPTTQSRSHAMRAVAVSRLVPWKGVHYTIRAFAMARRTLGGGELHVVGDGPQRQELERLAAELVGPDAVVFHGAVPEAEVRRQLQASDVLLQHSLDHEDGWVEGFGVSITEAAACEVPVIATRCGGIPDQVVDGETRFLIPQRDVRAMADAIVTLGVDPPLRRWLGVQGRARVAEHFDTAEQVRRLENVLLSVATRPAHRP